jgi:salicylate hydroxylase
MNESLPKGRKSQEKTEIIVVGGGIAGLTVAICLKQYGFECKVFERADDERTTTSAISLGSSGVRVLKELGLLSAVEARAQAVRLMRMIDSNGILVTELQLLGKEQYGQDSMAMTRRVLHEVLTLECKRLGVVVSYGCKLLSITQDDTSVEALFQNGVSVVGRACIGADGIRSTVRTSMFPDLQVESKDRLYFGCGAIIPNHYLTADERAKLRLSEGSMNTISGRVGFAGFIGVGTPDAPNENKFMFWSHIAKFDVTDDFDCKDLSKVKRTLLRLRGSWCDPIAKVVDLLDKGLPDVEVLAGPVFSNGAIPRWFDRRVVLIGDAAHGYGPGASGAALAMEDALLLVRMLKRDDDNTLASLERVFRDFEDKRRPRVEAIGVAAEARNDARLTDQGYWRMKAKEYAMWVYGWWCNYVYYDSHSAYTVDEDLKRTP